jgi:hypothetical protein
MLAADFTADQAPQYSDWSAPVNLGPVVNTDSSEIEVAISKDGRSLYFASNRPGGFGLEDIYVSRRASVDAPWGPPQNLGAPINTAYDDRTPMLPRDGHRLFFTSDRPGGFGGQDVYVSRRRDKRDDLAWGAPQNIGSGVNTTFNENLPFYFEIDGEDGEEGAVTLYFNSNRLGGFGGTDIYASTLQPDGTFGPAAFVPELSSPLRDAGIGIRRDGLELIIASDRVGTFGAFDLWVSTRASTSEPWSTPVNLGPVVNSPVGEARLSLSHDATTLYISGDHRAGGFGRQDLWVSTRSKLGSDDVDDDDDADDDHFPRFSDWSAPINLGPVVNSTVGDLEVSISKNGLSLYIASSRPGGIGDFDIWVSQRTSVDAPWGTPQNLGPTINTAGREQAPFLTLDGHRLYFFSDRPGGFAGTDLYVSRRRDKHDDFGWEAPVNLGSGVNTSFNETVPVYFEDEASETTTLYFGSNRPGMGGTDIYVSTLLPDETFGPAVRVDVLNSSVRDAPFTIRRDGLEMFLASDRPGTLGAFDVWVTTRASTADPWSTPVNLGPVVNSSADDSRGALSFDGTTLYLESNRPGTVGGHDLWVSTRTKLKDPGLTG